jgi:hypothetical protein
VSKGSLGSTIGSAIAGAAVGMLVGIAAGLSSAPVIAVVVGAVSAGLLILLGLKKADPPPADPSAASANDHAVARIAAFGIVCTASLLIGVVLRSHDLLAPPAKAVEQTWKDAGFSDEQARQIALYQKVGLRFGTGDGKDGGLVESRPGTAGSGSTLLFATRAAEPCTYFNRKNYATTDYMLQAMELQGGDLKNFATAARTIRGSTQRDQVIDAAGALLCAPQE